MKRTDLKLPDHALLFQGVPHYTADQMREYGRACERAAYERAAQLCEERAGTVSMFASSKEDVTHNRAVRGCAAAIRALGASK